MIFRRETRAPQEAARLFAEWAAHLHGKLLVILEVYADESGTHDETGQEPNSEVAVIMGYVASHEAWVKFSESWRELLKLYNIPFFHFRDFDARRRNPQDETNPYHHLNDEQLEEMLYALAIVAGAAAVPVGGLYHIKRHNDEKAEGDSTIRLWEAFFNGFWEQMSMHWPGFVEPISFIFDQNKNPKWMAALNQVCLAAQQKDNRISSWAFANDKTTLPLQAADLYAYVSRQAGVPFMESGKQLQPMRILDIALNKNHSPNQYDPYQWVIGIYAMIDDMRRQRNEAKASGLPRKNYYPLSDHPFFKK
jgi:hypothetical protein